MSGRVLIVGGYGRAGLKTAERLARGSAVSEITVAGRDGVRAAKAAARIDLKSQVRVLWQRLDVTHEEEAAEAVRNHDLVIMNTESNVEHIAGLVIQSAKMMISIAAGVASNRALERLGRSAQTKGALIVSETGLAPGLMSVLAKELVGRGAHGELNMVLTLDLVGRHGAEAIAWTLAQLGSAAGFVRGERGRKLYPVNFADSSAIASRVGLATASSFLAFRPDLSPINLALSARYFTGRERGLEALSAAAATIFEAFGLATDQVRLDVTISDGSATFKAVFQGHNQSSITGALTARTAEIALDRRFTGAKKMDEIMTWSDAEALFSDMDAGIEFS